MGYGHVVEGYGIRSCSGGYGIRSCSGGYGIRSCSGGYGTSSCSGGYGIWSCSGGLWDMVIVMRAERDTGSTRLDWLTYIKRKYIYMSIILRNACSAHARITPLPLFLVVYICSVAIRSFSCSGWISVWSLFYTVWNWFRLVFYCR